MPKRGSLHCKETPSSNGEGRFLVLSSSFLCIESQPRYASTQPLQVSFRQALLPFGEAGRGFKRAFLVLSSSFLCTESQPRYTSTLPLQVSFRQALLPLGEAGRGFKRAFLCFVFIVSVYRIIALLCINPASPSQLPLGTSPPLEGLGEAFNDTILPYWNIMCIFVMFVL